MSLHAIANAAPHSAPHAKARDPGARITNAVPGDLTPIDGGDGAQFVLEIGGGLAARLGIAPGAEMRSDKVGQDAAVWPCN